jgi:hypothetical protein
VFRRFIDGTVTPASCLEAYHLHITRLELVVEPKLRNRQLTDDGNVEITGRDPRARRGWVPLRWPTQITHTGMPGNGRKLEADD